MQCLRFFLPLQDSHATCISLPESGLRSKRRGALALFAFYGCEAVDFYSIIKVIINYLKIKAILLFEESFCTIETGCSACEVKSQLLACPKGHSRQWRWML
jgi:hypothetical protein